MKRGQATPARKGQKRGEGLPVRSVTPTVSKEQGTRSNSCPPSPSISSASSMEAYETKEPEQDFPELKKMPRVTQKASHVVTTFENGFDSLRDAIKSMDRASLSVRNAVLSTIAEVEDLVKAKISELSCNKQATLAPCNSREDEIIRRLTAIEKRLPPQPTMASIVSNLKGEIAPNKLQQSKPPSAGQLTQPKIT